MVNDMSLDEVRSALNWLEANYSSAMDNDDASLAASISVKMYPLYRRLQELLDQERDWGMEWYDTSLELA